MKFLNPFSFSPGPVTFWTTVIYLAVTIPLIYVHEVVPPVPSGHSLKQGLNLSEAWFDLQTITKQYHPYNSRANAEVREYLIKRSQNILDRNGVPYKTETSGGVIWDDKFEHSAVRDTLDAPRTSRAPGATIFDDRISNVTWTVDSLLQSTKGGSKTWQGYYFEGDNFYVYIHGKEDPEGDWWSSQVGAAKYSQSGGVLVNCHFDSVSTGYGATDDGVSCVSMLQLLSYFTTEGHQPKHGVVLLFNNAEEDGLLGARAFGYSPLLKFCHTFVNLEGAGAGGRAMLFRTTDLEAAEVYSKSPHPFGSVVAANAFERGVIKSGTDFEVFAPNFGQRGMDIAFYHPRSRYHTEDDDARHTSVRSIWHMLSAALASTERFSEVTGTVFSGDRPDGDKNLAQTGKPTEGVYFDWYGSGWSAFPLRGLFAWSLTLLIVTPLVLAVATFLLIRSDKYYFWAKDIQLEHSEIHDDPIALSGWRGFFRYPLALIFAIGLTIGAVLLVAKVNPLIIYSSGYAVWAQLLSLFYCSFWLIMRGANFVRPTALHRGFALIWLFILSWFVQVIAAIAEDRMHIGGIYFTAFFHTAIFVSLFISLVEQFALPGKQDFANQYQDDAAPEHTRITSSDNTITGNEDDQDEQGYAAAESATETTPLRAGEQGYGSSDQPTFASTYRRSAQTYDQPAPSPLQSYPPYEHEQSWSGRLPTWTWIIQFLLLAPIHVILVGNLGLVQTSAMAMNGADGGSLLPPIMGVGIMAILLLLPLTPFMHRITHHVPLFLFVVFVATFIYNLAAFPFSNNARYKLYFQEVIDVDAGTNVASLSGIYEYVHSVVSTIPSATGQEVNCKASTRSGLTACEYDVSSLPPYLANGTELKDLITATSSVSLDGKTANFKVDALDTKMCILSLSQPVFGFEVKGAAPADRRFGTIPRDGLTTITLFRREWEGPWDLTLQLVTDDGRVLLGDDDLDVTVRCAYSDMNDDKTIPVLRELYQYMPKWAVISKTAVGLVEVRKKFTVS
ncbi:Peptidase family M28 protein [Trichoderma guizhouense]|uniref:Peptide hydrolase n=1 Tax=Trichoderma guizhouense TaxID=1491466 RepID=A0A1T3CUW2_9HYPO|nr:Peptidase family M28 protein [Trichoderma guizhouense]